MFFVSLCVFVILFNGINGFALREWDESRVASNAIEMYRTNNFIVPTYLGDHELWNTKPPFLLWIQVISMHVFGVNEFAVRFPSLLSAIGICLTFMLISKKYFGNIYLGLLSSLFLVSNFAFVMLHGAMTADYDTLLCFCIFGFSISYYMFLETKNNKYFIAFFVLLIVAVLTKGVSALMFMPGILIYTFYKRCFLYVINHPNFTYGAMFFVLIIGGYYWIHEAYAEGYIKAVWENELGGRFNSSLEGHQHEWYYYFKFYWEETGLYYKYFVLILPMLFFVKNKKIKQLGVWSFVMVIPFLILISIAKTKLYWYSMPFQVFYVFMLGLVFYSILLKIRLLLFPKQLIDLLSISLVIALVFYPINKMFAYSKYFTTQDFKKNYTYREVILNNLYKGYINKNSKIYLVEEEVEQKAVFYKHKLEMEGYKVSIVKVPEFEEGAYVFTNKNQKTCRILCERFNGFVEALDSNKTYKIFKVKKSLIYRKDEIDVPYKTGEINVKFLPEKIIISSNILLKKEFIVFCHIFIDGKGWLNKDYDFKKDAYADTINLNGLKYKHAEIGQYIKENGGYKNIWEAKY